MRNITGV